jgi:hypothetical protein
MNALNVDYSPDFFISVLSLHLYLTLSKTQLQKAFSLNAGALSL